MRIFRRSLIPLLTAVSALNVATPTLLTAQRTERPQLHGRHWVAITGKPLAATAGAAIFQQGGNAVDASVAMLAAACTMWDTLGCGGETQALIYHPGLKKVIGINAMGVARLRAGVRALHVGTDHSDLARPQARHDVGRGEQLR